MRKAFACLCPWMSLGLIAGGQAKKTAAKPAYLRVKLPDDKTELLVDGKPTKQEGKTRVFVTPPLEPGKTFTYTLTARWEGKGGAETVRTRRVSVQAGKVIDVDLTKADPKNHDKVEVPPPDVGVEMCKLARVGKDDIVYDVACGEGGAVITALATFKAKKGIGFDTDAKDLDAAAESAKEYKVTDRVTFRKMDIFAITDFSEA